MKTEPEMEETGATELIEAGSDIAGNVVGADLGFVVAGRIEVGF